MVSAIRKSSQATPETKVGLMIRHVCQSMPSVKQDKKGPKTTVFTGESIYGSHSGWGKQSPPPPLESNGLQEAGQENVISVLKKLLCKREQRNKEWMLEGKLTQERVLLCFPGAFLLAVKWSR